MFCEAIHLNTKTCTPFFELHPDSGLVSTFTLLSKNILRVEKTNLTIARRKHTVLYSGVVYSLMDNMLQTGGEVHRHVTDMSTDIYLASCGRSGFKYMQYRYIMFIAVSYFSIKCFNSLQAIVLL